MYLEDYWARAGELGGHGLVGALDEDRVGAEVSNLAANPERQGRPEARPVERPRRDEVEGLVAARTAGQDAHVELFVERVELSPKARLERQPVARAPDDQDARLHAAARARISSNCP